MGSAQAPQRVGHAELSADSEVDPETSLQLGLEPLQTNRIGVDDQQERPGRPQARPFGGLPTHEVTVEACC
jgi:hypothetical protein